MESTDTENCFACNELIDQVDQDKKGCQALGHSYHVKCLLCTDCSKTLVGAPFYVLNDKPYCEADYAKKMEKCAACSEPITKKILKASDKSYHPQCFTCSACKGQLEGVAFKSDPELGVHCINCYRDKFSPRCAICRKPIVPEAGKSEASRILSLNKSYHVDCYACQDCGMKLSSRVEGHECYPFEDCLLCKKCNEARRKKTE